MIIQIRGNKINPIIADSDFLNTHINVFYIDDDVVISQCVIDEKFPDYLLYNKIEKTHILNEKGKLVKIIKNINPIYVTLHKTI